MEALLLFLLVFILILSGFPVAFTLGGVALIAGAVLVGDPSFFEFLPMRIFGIMQNEILIAVPLFIYMGIMLEKSGLAERLLETMALLFGRMPGGLAISVVVVGALLAASTGIVGATVVTMGLISLPTMLKRGYRPELARCDRFLGYPGTNHSSFDRISTLEQPTEQYFGTKYGIGRRVIQSWLAAKRTIGGFVSLVYPRYSHTTPFGSSSHASRGSRSVSAAGNVPADCQGFSAAYGTYSSCTGLDFFGYSLAHRGGWCGGLWGDFTNNTRRKV